MKTLEQLNQCLDNLKAAIILIMNKEIGITNGSWLEIETNVGKYHVKIKDVNENGIIDVWLGYNHILKKYFKCPVCKVSQVTSIRKLSHSEIQHLLTRYCTDGLGIKAGVTVERSEEMARLTRFGFAKTKVKIINDNINYYSDIDALGIGDCYVYCKGHFAKVVEDVITIDGQEVEFKERYPKIKDVLFDDHEIAAIHAALTCPDPLTAEKCKKILDKRGGAK